MRWFGKRNKGDRQQQGGRPPSGSAAPPAAKDRVVRVFISSTFRDMFREREIGQTRLTTTAQAIRGAVRDLGRSTVGRSLLRRCIFDPVFPKRCAGLDDNHKWRVDRNDLIRSCLGGENSTGPCLEVGTVQARNLETVRKPGILIGRTPCSSVLATLLTSR